MTNEEIRAELQRAIDEEHVMLFMKGTPDCLAAASPRE